MRQAHHIVHRQSLEVAFERPGQEPGMQERVAAVYHQRILPELEKVFGEFEDNWPGSLTIPIVSIDCGILHEADWEEALAENVFRKVREALHQYRGLRMESPQLERQWNAEFIHFLQTGRFQWDSRKEVPTDYESRLVLNKLFLDELTAAMRVTEDVLKRLLHYCTSKFVVRLADALAADRITPAGVTNINLLKQAGVEAAVRSRAVVSAYCILHARPVVHVTSFAIALANSIWPVIDSTQRAKLVERIAQSQPISADTDFITALFPLIASEFPEWATTLRRQGNAERDEPTTDPILLNEEKDAEQQSMEQKSVEQKATAQQSAEHIHTDRVVETYYIANAGLVLAYPFIAALLQRTGLMDDDQQFFPDASGNATALLQHLVYESPLVEENELPLNKLLVGLHPTVFVDPELFEYSARIQRECEDVLHAIIAHWSVLRNTSVSGIRETFLQREGKLTSRADGWLLQVDSRGVDVLLASLPWSIGIVKLPWMEGMLYVEWA